MSTGRPCTHSVVPWTTPDSVRTTGPAAATSLIGIDWYDGSEGLQDASQPTLAIGMANGRLQLQLTKEKHNMLEARRLGFSQRFATHRAFIWSSVVIYS